jgi:plasmid stabilization system protein ParE
VQREKMLKLIQQRAAQNDVDLLSDYLTNKAGFRIATNFATALENAYKLLCSQPHIGVKRDHLMKNIRIWRVSGFPKILIFYLVYEDRLEIVRVMNGIRNIEAIFAEQEQNQ